MIACELVPRAVLTLVLRHAAAEYVSTEQTRRFASGSRPSWKSTRTWQSRRSTSKRPSSWGRPRRASRPWRKVCILAILLFAHQIPARSRLSSSPASLSSCLALPLACFRPAFLPWPTSFPCTKTKSGGDTCHMVHTVWHVLHSRRHTIIRRTPAAGCLLALWRVEGCRRSWPRKTEPVVPWQLTHCSMKPTGSCSCCAARWIKPSRGACRRAGSPRTSRISSRIVELPHSSSAWAKPTPSWHSLSR
jgi:hypothetical protein